VIRSYDRTAISGLRPLFTRYYKPNISQTFWLLLAVHCRSSTRLPLRINQNFSTSLGGTLSHFYTTPVPHQPNLLGFAQRYTAAPLHGHHLSSTGFLRTPKRYTAALLSDHHSQVVSSRLPTVKQSEGRTY